MTRFILFISIILIFLIFVVKNKILFPPIFAQNSPPANFKVAFIGDTSTGTAFGNVLNLIKAENAQLVLHQGDMGYSSSASTWGSQVNNSALGSNFPYLMSDGNHENWSDYKPFADDRLRKMGVYNTTIFGSDPANYSTVYQGLKLVFVKEGGDPTFIQQQLQNAPQTWKICSWHKNMAAMQVGGKGDEQGWPSYETCLRYGAIIATGHEHSYARTKTLTSAQNQTVDPSCSDPRNLCVAPGKTFVFVSGIGGQSSRDQTRCLPTTYPYGCRGEWAKIYTISQNPPAVQGALFIVFNYNGNPNKAHGYFKNIRNEIIDEFDITAGINHVPNSSPGSCVRGSLGNIDCSSDGCITTADFVLFSNDFGKPIANPPAGQYSRNLYTGDNSSIINTADYQILSNNFGRCNSLSPT